MAKSTVKVEMELPAPPEGYEYTGEYRSPKVNEPYLDCGNNINFGLVAAYAAYPIVRAIVKYRTPSLPMDLGKDVQFADFEDDKDWAKGQLVGYVGSVGGRPQWVSAKGITWNYARIRDDV